MLSGLNTWPVATPPTAWFTVVIANTIENVNTNVCAEVINYTSIIYNDNVYTMIISVYNI